MPLEPNPQALYHRLAWLWPLTSPPEDYVDEAAEIAALLREYSAREPKTLLDLGCGGGHNDHALKHEFTITGVDLSEDMLALAQQLNPEITYLQGDMRKIRLGQQFDAVLIADAIDYMLTEADLRAALKTGYAHLNPGGVLLTYAEETRERFEQNKTRTVTHTTTHTNGPITVTSIENFFAPDPNATTYECTFVYLIRQNGALTLETDRHLCGLFPLATWIELLEDVGFTVHIIEYEEVGPMFVGVK